MMEQSFHHLVGTQRQNSYAEPFWLRRPGFGGAGRHGAQVQPVQEGHAPGQEQKMLRSRKRQQIPPSRDARRLARSFAGSGRRSARADCKRSAERCASARSEAEVRRCCGQTSRWWASCANPAEVICMSVQDPVDDLTEHSGRATNLVPRKQMSSQSRWMEGVWLDFSVKDLFAKAKTTG